MIVRDEADNLKRLLPAIAPFFDEIVIADTGSKDSTVTYLNGYSWKKLNDKSGKNRKVTVVDFPWVDDFSAARNAAKEATQSDWIFWVDADDDVEGIENLQAMCDAGENVIWFFEYVYARETVQWRERLFPNIEPIYWKGRLHETVMGSQNLIHSKADEVRVIHRKQQEEYLAANERNTRILEKEVLEDIEHADPRSIYYLAQCYRGQQEHSKAAEMYTRYLQTGGWDEEKYDSWWQLGDSLRLMNKFQPSQMACFEAMKLFPERPEAYFQLAMLCFDWGLASGNSRYFEAVVEWSDTGFSKPMPQTIRVVNKSRLTWQPMFIKALALLHLGNTTDAYPLAQKALRISNFDELAKKDFEVIEELWAGNEAVNGFLTYAYYLKSIGDTDHLKGLVASIPEQLGIDSRVLAIRNDVADPKYWDKDEIAIFCGKSLEDWADPSVTKGIGGSEEAVIYLSRELAKLGWKVTVYNQCGALSGDFANGMIKYRPYYEFNPRDHFNTLITWRSTALLNLEVDAKKTYLWLHDKPTEEHVPTEVLPKLTKVIFISEWQRSQVPHVPDDKVLISANGLNMVDIVNADGEERKPHRMIWSSSYDRGIEHLLERWGKIREAIPDAELVICYGWENFLKGRSHDGNAMAWKAMVDKLMEQDGIIHLGRINQKKLAKEFAQASIWPYFCCFWETSCITAMRAQASGTFPITTDYAALGETVQRGMKFEGITDFMVFPEALADEMVEEVINQLKEPVTDDYRTEMKDWARSKFAWSNIASQWDSEFKS